MVDANLPIESRERPLRYLFLDLNSYFASVEQNERPELRGKPVAVAPVATDSTCVIAASYEAKKYGVKCGTNVGEARVMCPGIEILQARPPVYVGYHRKILKVAESLLPIEQVCSIDEMRFRLLGNERTPTNSAKLAKELKRRIHEAVGPCMTSSIGVAPNSFLAKAATDMMKPDGLVVIEAQDLPDRLYSLKLTDFAGINYRMKVRLNAAGIFTTEQMCAASRHDLLVAFGGIMGERWWYMLRGYDISLDIRTNQTLGHSHVLAPDLRNDEGCRGVMLRLIGKAAARLRANSLWAGGMSIGVSGIEKGWHTHRRIAPTQDTIRFNEHFQEMWEERDFRMPRGVGVTFDNLRPAEEVTPSLFEPSNERALLNRAVDNLNQKYGKHSVFLGNITHTRHTADEKIAFNKTWLFSEGKGDNEWGDSDEWVDTFRGLNLSHA